MRYLKEYEEQEIKDLMGGLETIGHQNLQGWIIIKHWSTGAGKNPTNPGGVVKYIIDFYVVGAHSFEEAIKIFHSTAFPDTRYKFWSDIKDEIVDEESFLATWVSEYGNHKREWNELLDADIVWGLKGKAGKPFFAKLDAENPFAVISFLNQKFTNAEEEFTKRFGYGPGFTQEYKEF